MRVFVARLAGTVEMILVALIWGSVSVFSIWVDVPSPVFVLYRVLIASPIMIVHVAMKYRSFKKPNFLVLISGVLLTLNWILFFTAIRLSGVPQASLLYYSGPIFSILLSPPILKERYPRWIVFPASMAFFGIGIIFLDSNSHFNFSGSILGLLAGVSYGALAVVSKKANENMNSEMVVAYQVIVSSLLLLPFLFFVDYTVNLRKLFLILTTGIVHTALALVLWYDVLKKIPMYLAAILAYLDPVFAILLAYLLLNQVPSFNTILGGSLIISAGVLTTLKTFIEEERKPY